MVEVHASRFISPLGYTKETEIIRITTVMFVGQKLHISTNDQYSFIRQ